MLTIPSKRRQEKNSDTLKTFASLTEKEKKEVYIQLIEEILPTSTPQKWRIDNGGKHSSYFLICEFLSDAYIMYYKNNVYVWDGKRDIVGRPDFDNSLKIRGKTLFMSKATPEEIGLVQKVRQHLKNKKLLLL